MRIRTKGSLLLLVGVLAMLLAMSLACARAEPTPTPVPPTPPAPARTPTPVTMPTPVAVPTPTPKPVAKDQPRYGGTVRWADFRGFDTLDPAYQQESAARRVMYPLYGNLVQIKADGTIAPDLAKSWEFSGDSKTITFTLQEGAKFHDGTPADARAVKWNYDRYLDSKVGSPRGLELRPPLERVEVVDSQKVRFQVSQAWRPFLNQLTRAPGQLASPTAVEKMASYDNRRGPFASNPVGAGMFKFKEWIPGQRIVLVRNENYFKKGLPYLDEIRALDIPDTRVMFAMLRTNELEAMENLAAGDYELAKNNPSVRVLSLNAVRGRVIYFKVTTPPWDNKALRQAFAYAMDRRTIVNVMYQGFAAEEAYSAIYSGDGFWHDPTFRMFEYNPQKAKEKLAEAGYAKGFSYNQPCRASTWELEFCEVVQVMLAGVGIKMEVRPWDAITYFNDWVAGRYGEGTWAGYRSRGDPDLTLRLFLHSKGASNTANRSNYRNPKFDELLDQAVGIYDEAEAKKIYRKALEIVVDDAPVVYQVAESTLYGINADVRNFAPPPDGESRLQELWLAR